MIELENVTKRYGAKKAVDNVSMTIEEGALTLLIGPSGSGKTTTMKMVNRLISPETGDIRLDGRSIFQIDPVRLRRTIGYVIQEVGLFPHFTVHDNIAVVPRLLKWDEKKIAARVPEVLDLVTLDESFAHRRPHQLSGGERQRVGLARALAADPEILLMDEPFGAIDPINRGRLQDSLLDIQERLRKTIVFVTHDINEAIKLGDRVAIMREGALVQHDTVARILREPADTFVEELLGKDRNLKALALKKAKELACSTGYIVAPDSDSEAELARKMAAADTGQAFLVDAGGALSGRFVRGVVGGSCGEAPPAVDRNANLNEALSLMLMAGEKELPVVDHQRAVVGTINLQDIFEQFTTSSDDE
jgi:osmoprotectant transport system ATP-binding protein